MYISAKFLAKKAIILATLLVSSTAVFADGDRDHDNENNVFPGIINPCEQLWLVNDPNNPYEAANEGGECIDIPVNLSKAKVVFNLDTTTTNPDGSPTGLKHMYMFGTVMKHRIELGLVDPKDVAIVGVMHGEAMRDKWAFKNIPEGNNPVTYWIEKILLLKKEGINIQLEACGVALKGMQKNGATLANGEPLDERAIYSSANGKVYLNQGAVGRIIDLQQNDFVYLQED